MERLNVHIYSSTITHQTRTLRITRSLADLRLFSRIVILAIAGDDVRDRESLDEYREVVRIPTRFAPRGFGAVGKLLRALEWQLRALIWMCRLRPVCINCHNLWLLPICVTAKWLVRGRLVYDTHELETETVQSKGLRRAVGKLVERVLIRAADETVVVGAAIGDWYREAYGLPRVHVIRNIPNAFRGAAQRSTLLQETCGLGDQDQVFLYQGVIAKGRGVELLLEAFRQLPPHQHLIFLGYGPKSDLVQDWARRYSNIHYLPAVTPDRLPWYSMSAHVGLAIIENVSKSYYYCLPNKLFEYIQAGVPVIVSDFPEMASIVDQHQCGWKVRVSVDDVVRQIRAIDSAALAEKKNAVLACRELLTWERESLELKNLYRELFPTLMDCSDSDWAQQKAA